MTTDVTKTYEIEREPVYITYHEKSLLRDVYGFASSQGLVSLDGYRWKPRGRDSKTVFMYMHPASTMHSLPVPAAMVQAGAHIMLCGGRYNRNDTALIMENVIKDYAAYVRHAKEVFGYEKVIIVGWSGGGSLGAFYQSQAENTTITETPAGDPVDLSGLIPGDAMVFQAGQVSRALILRDFIDPSVLDENNPEIRDYELDLYDPRNPNQPPYSADYIAYFRKAQVARIRRKTAYVKELLHKLRTAGGPEIERGIITHRTLADPRFLDITLDPNDRTPGMCFLGVPEQANNVPAGIARFSTLRAWLSHWSFEDSNANALVGGKYITVPLLCIENSADEAIPQPHTKSFFDVVGSQDKRYELIKGANHYYHGQPELCDVSIKLIMDWARERNLLD